MRMVMLKWKFMSLKPAARFFLPGRSRRRHCLCGVAALGCAAHG